MSDRKLCIGGTEAKLGWEILNIQDGPYVDHCQNATDLSKFDDATYSIVYASHVLEHLELNKAITFLKECHRILEKDGALLVSVPNFSLLSKLVEHQGVEASDRIKIMRMIFGGQIDQYDYHYFGYTKEILNYVAGASGFKSILYVDRFAIFDDTSELKIGKFLISLNAKLTK